MIDPEFREAYHRHKMVLYRFAYRLPILAILFIVWPALACTCVPVVNSTAKTEMRGVSLVFRGTVIERKTLPLRPDMRGRGRYAITFRVEEYWKGSPRQTVTLYGMDGGTDCLGGDEYEVGKNYLIYANEVEVKDVILGDFFWYGWTDVLPKGAKMLIPAACPPGGEASAVRKALGQLGKGHTPGTNQ